MFASQLVRTTDAIRADGLTGRLVELDYRPTSACVYMDRPLRSIHGQLCTVNWHRYSIINVRPSVRPLDPSVCWWHVYARVRVIGRNTS